MKRILIVDDEPIIRTSVSNYLSNHGFIPVEAANGEQAYSIACKTPPDVMLLDVNMPKEDGFSVCNRFKQTQELASIPIIILSVRSDEVDRVVGLEIGADDYMTKPFSMRELVARIKAVSRRATTPNNTPELIFGQLKINFIKRTVYWSNNNLNLTTKEFDLLSYFVINSDRILSRGELLDTLWGVDYDGDIRSVDNHIKNLRAKMKLAGITGQSIISIHSRGYQWQKTRTIPEQG